MIIRYRDKEVIQYKEVIKKLSNNNNIVILKQDKDRDILVMNRIAYLEKQFTLLNISQFNKLTKDPTHGKYKEWKIQRVVRKMKLKLPSNVYSKTFPTDSGPGKFYGLLKSTNCHQMILLTNYHLDPLYQTLALQRPICQNT